MNLPYIIKKPIITERSLLAAQAGSYTFEVDPQATKGQIKQAIEAFFKVSVLSVNTTMLSGKRRRVGRLRRPTVGTKRKKAVIQIKSGQTIDLFDVQG